jgi:hypothetical protein
VRAALAGRISELFDRPVPPAGLATPVSFTLLTSLAEGADRLVATEIMKLPDSEIEAVLPLAPEDYMQDFATPESKRDFENWLSKAKKTLVLRRNGPETGKPEIRNKAYEDSGRFVVDHCDLLIALWDGKPARGKGGTAEIIAYAREKRRPLVIIPILNPEDIRIERGRGLSSRALKRFAYFNHFPISAAKLQAYAANMGRLLFQNPEGEKIPEAVKSRIHSGLLPWYVRASLIAKQNQKRYFRAGLAVYTLSPLAVGAVVIGILAPGWSLAAFLGEFLLMMVVYGIVLIADRRKVHKKWIEMRFLTERLRAAIFLFACGSKPADLRLPPLARTALRDDEWILRLFEEIMRRVSLPERRTEAVLRDCANFARTRWVGEQITFHAAKASRAGKSSRFLERIGHSVFLAAIFAAAWHIFSQLLGYNGILSWLEKPAIFLAVVLPAVGAAIGGVRTHREYSRLEKRSRSMEAVLRELDQRYAGMSDFDELKTLLQETEQLMLQETQDWLMLMKFARMEAI